MSYSHAAFRSARTLSVFAVVCLATVVLCEAAAALIGIAQIIDPERAIDFGDGDQSTWLIVQSFLALAHFIAYVGSVVFFLMWLFRAYKNLDVLETTHREFTAGWAVGWWFIPFAKLVKPFQAVREAWWDSDPQINDEPTFLSASLKSAPTFMGLWWGFWIASNIFANITSRVFDPDSMDNVQLTGFLFLISGILSGVAAVLAIKVVRDITERQEMRHINLEGRGHFSPPPPPEFGQTV
jgi:hypothetical protein